MKYDMIKITINFIVNFYARVENIISKYLDTIKFE